MEKLCAIEQNRTTQSRYIMDALTPDRESAVLGCWCRPAAGFGGKVHLARTQERRRDRLVFGLSVPETGARDHSLRNDLAAPAIPMSPKRALRADLTVGIIDTFLVWTAQNTVRYSDGFRLVLLNEYLNALRDGQVGTDIPIL